jgi:predicted acylesterase/phospholipase RssA
VTLGIAFEGCGCRAAFHVGAVEWLAAHGLEFASVAGASSGALIAGAVAQRRTRELRPAWMELTGTPVCDARRLLRARWPFRMSEIVGSAARHYFGDTRLADTLIPLAIVVTQLRARGFMRRTLTAQDDVLVATAVRASCFIPGPYSRMVPIDCRPTFDGAWLQRVPVREAADMGASRVIACVSDSDGRLLRGAWRAVPVEEPKGVDYRVLSPIAPIPVRTFDFDPAATLESFDIGARSAEAFMARHHAWLARENPDRGNKERGSGIGAVPIPEVGVTSRR